MRSLLIAALAALLALPAHAERKVCHVIRVSNGIISQTGAVIEPKFDRLLIQTGPIIADLKMREGVGWKPVPGADKDVGFYIYWYGDELPGKSWRDPGSILFKHGGFALQWPNFQDSTTYRLGDMRTVLKMGKATSDRRFGLMQWRNNTLMQQVMVLDQRMWAEWPYNWDKRTFFQDEWPAWIQEFRKGGRLTVEFWDTGKTPFATAEFDLPELTAFNARANEDVKDFRAKVDPKACPSGPRGTLP